MTDPIAMIVHDGSGVPPVWRRELIAEWLTANGIDPDHVHADAPISILTVPYAPSSDDEPWYIKVVLFTQLFVNEQGAKEHSFLAHEPVRFQRTVPLTTPFPADPTPGDEGTHHGQEPEVAPDEEGQRPPQHQERTEADE